MVKSALYLFFLYKTTILVFFIFLQQECRTLVSPSLFTILRIGQVPENLEKFSRAPINLPGGGVRNGRWGERNFRAVLAISAAALYDWRQ
jgi:hypothetical protein